MSSLLNTTWTITAENHDFNTQTITFSANNVVSVTFLPSGTTVKGVWSEGAHKVSFSARYSSTSNEEYNLLGSHQSGQGSGIAYIDWSGGTQKSPFTMSENS